MGDWLGLKDIVRFAERMGYKVGLKQMVRIWLVSVGCQSLHHPGNGESANTIGSRKLG
jgi:hypothetical protein